MRVRRRMLGLGSLASVAALAACNPTQAAPSPTETPTRPTPVPPYQIRVQLRPQEPRLGQDEHVVLQASFFTTQNRPVPGAQLSAVVNYPTGPRTFTSEVTTFPDGRAGDLLIPVAPATRGSTVRIEVIMRYQGQEYRANTGFTVR